MEERSGTGPLGFASVDTSVRPVRPLRECTGLRRTSVYRGALDGLDRLWFKAGTSAPWCLQLVLASHKLIPPPLHTNTNTFVCIYINLIIIIYEVNPTFIWKSGDT